MKKFNQWIALKITNVVSTMWCAYLFMILALLGLRPALKPGGEGLIAWIAQTFLQLVLLSVIMVGQKIQADQAIVHHKELKAHITKVHKDKWELLKLLFTSTRACWSRSTCTCTTASSAHGPCSRLRLTLWSLRTSWVCRSTLYPMDHTISNTNATVVKWSIKSYSYDTIMLYQARFSPHRRAF